MWGGGQMGKGRWQRAGETNEGGVKQVPRQTFFSFVKYVSAAVKPSLSHLPFIFIWDFCYVATLFFAVATTRAIRPLGVRHSISTLSIRTLCTRDITIKINVANKHHKSQVYCKSKRRVLVTFFGASRYVHVVSYRIGQTTIQISYQQENFIVLFLYTCDRGQRFASLFVLAKSPNVPTAFHRCYWVLLSVYCCQSRSLIRRSVSLGVLKEAVSFVPSMSRLILVSSGGLSARAIKRQSYFATIG